tara:strand:- start:38 stop:565 length:528 start_codon:yes stop_codon:yes gene_type:complete
MNLSDKEKKYIERIVESDGDIVVEAMIDIINKKRNDDEKVELADVVTFIEEISSSNKKDNNLKSKTTSSKKESKQLKRAKALLEIEDLDSQVNDIGYIALGVLQEAIPTLLEILKPSPPVDYTIISGKTQAYLEQEVKKYMSVGWQPFGGVGAAAFGISPVAGNQYIQAMVKYRK